MIYIFTFLFEFRCLMTKICSSYIFLSYKFTVFHHYNYILICFLLWALFLADAPDRLSLDDEHGGTVLIFSHGRLSGKSMKWVTDFLSGLISWEERVMGSSDWVTAHLKPILNVFWNSSPAPMA